MPKKIEIRVSPETANNDHQLKDVLAQELGIASSKINAFQILKRSLDARAKNIVYQIQVNVFVEEPFKDEFAFEPKLQNVELAERVVIAGAGPAGLFAALQLIELGFRPLILERGKDVRSRRRDLAVLNKEGKVNPESNYCYGEGGAGTYSDGKLYTRSNKRGSILKSLQLFHYFGATEKILYEAHPHIGTNKLPHIISKMSAAIESCGGQIMFNTKLTDIITEDGKVKAVGVNGLGKIPTRALILATGHSARDIFHLLHDKGILIESKPYALGVRIEHPQELIDAIQYQCPLPEEKNPYLPPASYSLVSQESGRGVFSFCMCPGGIIAPASTDDGELVVNGWSPSKRDGLYANSGMVVSVSESDFAKHGFTGPLAGMQYQQMVEQKSWEAGGGKLVAPAQRVTDFVKQKLSSSLPENSYIPGLNSVRLNEVLPMEIYVPLSQGLISFGKKMKGYYTDEAIVVATESRTSSPVRIPRDKDSFQHPQITGLFPCAEGAGYAGGIISAAMDGEKVADAVGRFIKE
ncbi:MAG TPA: hypothetical protein VLZ83_04430 [Edaphocola sp.]|nr:hypothetical protein [Edaphocola sp.]